MARRKPTQKSGRKVEKYDNGVVVTTLGSDRRETKPPETGTLRRAHAKQLGSQNQSGASTGAGGIQIDMGEGRAPLILDAPALEVLAGRTHQVLESRSEQLDTNILAWKGGKDYIDERLSRYAGESRISWEGGSREDGVEVTGRKDQAHMIPYPGRIVGKINQYVFSQEVTRKGVTDEQRKALLDNISRDGRSIESVMAEVNSYLTVCEWVWLGVDMPKPPVEREGGQVTMEEKEEFAIRPYWNVYSPTEVVDWAFDDQGRLEWVLVESEYYDNSDPLKKPKCIRVRNLWLPGVRVEMQIGDDMGKGDKVTQVTAYPFHLDEVPFILVGKISDEPYLFDSIESINRTILDLESVSRQNYYDRCFPQMYLPASVVSATAHTLNIDPKKAIELIIGLNYPILLEQTDTPPGYIMPPEGGMSAIDEKVIKLRESMFECVGLMLRQESRAAASGESKAWDFLDAKQVLASRAIVLQEAERKAVELSVRWDPAFPDYTPVYPTDFDLGDVTADMASLADIAQVPMPVEMVRVILKRLFERVSRVGRADIDSAEVKAVLKAIDAFEQEKPEPLDDLLGKAAKGLLRGKPGQEGKPPEGEGGEPPNPDDEEDDEETKPGE